MFHYTDSISKNKIDTYVYISCSNFESNIKKLEKKFKFKFPKHFYAYFKGETKKVTKFFLKDKLFIIGKINEKKCNFKDIDSILQSVCSLIKSEKKILNVLFFLIPIKEFIRHQVMRIVYYMYAFDKHKTKKTAPKKSIHLCSQTTLFS